MRDNIEPKVASYIKAMTGLGISKSLAWQVLRDDTGPQTFRIGDRRMVEIGSLSRWIKQREQAERARRASESAK